MSCPENAPGSMMYCTFAVLFIAQVYGIELSIAQQVTMLLVLSAIHLAVALAGYETGKVDFATLLDAQRQIRNARLALLRAQAGQQQRLAEIERLLGEDL